MIPIGLILAILTAINIFLLFAFNHKLTKIFSSYWFYSILSLLGLVYFISYRWINDLKDWINNNPNNYLGGIDVVKSKVLLLDMCPFGFVILCIFLIVDKKRFLASSISFLGIIGGLVTIYGQIMFEGVGSSYNSPTWIKIIPNLSWWEYTFLNKAYFIMHYYILIMSIIVLMNTKGFNWTKIITTHVYCISFFSYITIMVFTLDIKWNATGIVENDWKPWGEYGVLGNMLNLPWPWPPIVVFTFVWILIIILMLTRNLMVINPKFNTNDLVIFKKCKNKYMELIAKFK